MRSLTRAIAAAAILACAAPALAQDNPFLGAWNLTGEAPNDNAVYWLEVRNDGGALSALFLNRGGSPVPIKDVKVADGTLTFTFPTGQKPTISLQASGDRLTGTVGSVKVTGVRPPKWDSCDATAKPALGTPVVLFDGKSLDAWDVQHKQRRMGWVVEDGTMTNDPKPKDPANNLVSKEKFDDFRLEAEYKLSPKGNSGIYLRGRYELQVLDDYGTEPETHGHMSIYARRAPRTVASKPAGEWQTAQITLVDNCVTVVLNGQTVHDNVRIAGITGGALDARETEPGPIMIQGDHEKVWFRKVVVTPITTGGGRR
jgi:hypothetical protein